MRSKKTKTRAPYGSVKAAREAAAAPKHDFSPFIEAAENRLENINTTIIGFEQKIEEQRLSLDTLYKRRDAAIAAIELLKSQ